MKVLLSVIALVAALLNIGPLRVHAQAKDPASVIAYGTAQVNAHNLDALMSIFADDAVVNNDGSVFTGKAQVREFMSMAVSDFISTAIVGEFTVTGNQVTWREADRLTSLTQIGVPVVYSSGEAIVENGLIKSMTFTTEPASVAAIQKAQASAPVGMPSTGGSDLAGRVALGILGALLLTLGSSLQRKSRTNR